MDKPRSQPSAEDIRRIWTEESTAYHGLAEYKGYIKFSIGVVIIGYGLIGFIVGTLGEDEGNGGAFKMMIAGFIWLVTIIVSTISAGLSLIPKTRLKRELKDRIPDDVLYNDWVPSLIVIHPYMLLMLLTIFNR